ncbi:type II toxin-antitoxin system YafQ family toxin [Pseudoramibacter sp.]|jgi:mRNA interferase YafQ|uniref:type II toxin-antitoxin system YafQ family toxin n=1 Tax=Pseudoramibacter sp. TaxID=2034862 RepID=UPI0025DE06EB|nr:type II toxin-antitoxin system YafQ family toxin [Pseudoramibacter sp.]MCH4072367.1 type II toxin-antitoxin system YafQ family toxin [Pseudoramibacter sp.]MCH4106138.1 type II toxin-antitoxin system YafQ family toxin [Pseudoramibacter sp.]
MTEYKIKRTTAFKRDYKRIKRRGYKLELLWTVIEKLVNDEVLPEKNKDHALTGQYSGFRECHISPDWLLVYKIEEDVLILTLSRTGSHSDLF